MKVGINENREGSRSFKESIKGSVLIKFPGKGYLILQQMYQRLREFREVRDKLLVISNHH